MREISLSRGKLAMVDDEDFDKIGHLKWYASSTNKGKVFYAARHTSRKSSKHKVIYMHRILLSCPEGMEVDHVDGNGLNNQKSNLRICSHHQNMCHSRKRPDVSSRFKGVHKPSKIKGWIAKIEIKGKVTTIGTFQSEIAAAMAYNEAAIKFHGEFANLNQFNQGENL